MSGGKDLNMFVAGARAYENVNSKRFSKIYLHHTTLNEEVTMCHLCVSVVVFAGLKVNYKFCYIVKLSGNFVDLFEMFINNGSKQFVFVKYSAMCVLSVQ